MAQNIGRFQVIRILGRGAQSVVFLAFDPQLQREVAIKTVHFAPQEDRELKVKALLQESLTVSRLQHPNIVPIFEAGEQDSNPYLVFEYVEGKTLSAMLKEEGALPVPRAIEIISQVLDAIAHAHAHQIIHRDLKPSNILMNVDGVPRVMDFGIATKQSVSVSQGNELMGTPAYMAPEYINSREVSVKGDIFAAGLILYEMIIGKRAVTGDDIFQILNKIITGPIFNPADAAEFIDDKLADIIQRALAADPADRYDSALEMKEALHTYMVMDENGLPLLSEQSRKSTLEFLLRRMRHRSDFPALSESISTINKIIAAGGSDSFENLARAVLKDVALTNKILKLVNSAYYGQREGGKITTISRAVVILGLDAVRNVAVALMLFDHMQDKAMVTQLKEEFLRAVFSAILAKIISAETSKNRSEAEEYFICAMFHNLGRMLSLFYFPEESKEIEKTMAQKGYSEEIASTQMLGISYSSLGMEIARTWGFPEQIVESMRRLPLGKLKEKETAQYSPQHIVATFTNELSGAIAGTPREKRTGAIHLVVARFENIVSLTDRQMATVLENAVGEAIQYAANIHFNLHYSHLGKHLLDWAGGIAAPADLSGDNATTVPGAPPPTASPILQTNPSPDDTEDSQSMLSQGLQDISQALIDGASVNTILRQILETLYHSMGFRNVLLCIKDRKTDSMTGRFGFGEDIALLTRDFRFSLQPGNDVFHTCLARNADILVSDIDHPKFAAAIPDWYRHTVPAKTFLLLPLSLKKVAVAMIYADKGLAGELAPNKKELSLIRAVRNQAALAFKQIV